MRVLPLALLATALATTGCLGAITDRFGGEEPPVVPGPVTLTGGVTPSLNKNETFDVPERMSSVTLDLTLAMKGTPDSPLPPLAQVEVAVKDPNAAPVGDKKTLSPQVRTGQITITNPLSGPYTIHLRGNGLGNEQQGASYTIVVTYAG